MSLLEKLRGRMAKREAPIGKNYKELVRQSVDTPDKIDVATAEEILAAAGKSLLEFEADQANYRRRKEIAAQLFDESAARAEADELARRIKEANDAAHAAWLHSKAVWDDLHPQENALLAKINSRQNILDQLVTSFRDEDVLSRETALSEDLKRLAAERIHLEQELSLDGNGAAGEPGWEWEKLKRHAAKLKEEGRPQESIEQTKRRAASWYESKVKPLERRLQAVKDRTAAIQAELQKIYQLKLIP